MADAQTDLNVLVVEDSESDTKLMMQALRSAGFAPTWERVDTSVALRDALARREFQLVISDSSVPRLGALEALALAKALAPEVPFIVVSGSAREELAAEVLRQGAADFVTKGELGRLAPAVERGLSRRAAPQPGSRPQRGAEHPAAQQGLARARAVVADDHPLFRAALSALLESLGVEVVGQAADGAEALRLVLAHAPTLALMDVAMPGMDALGAAHEVASRHPSTRVLILSMHSGDDVARDALAAGAAGYLLKTANRDELAQAVAALARGDSWPSAGARGQSSATWPRATPTDEARPQLTPRQREVLQLVVDGQSTKAIARRLQISVKTVETHRAEIMARLDIHNVAGLVHYAIRAGLLPRR